MQCGTFSKMQLSYKWVKMLSEPCSSNYQENKMLEYSFKYLSPQNFFLRKNFCSVTMIDPYVLKSFIYMTYDSFNIYINKLSRETLNNI